VDAGARVSLNFKRRNLMPKTNRPTIKIELGIQAAAKPSLHELRKRARSRAEVVAAGQPDLMFLVENDFPEISPLKVVDGAYVIEGPLPRKTQGRLDGQVSLTERDDTGDERDIEAVLEAVTLNSELLNEVAQLMATSPTLVDDIRWLEQRRGVKTGAMRCFVYQKQESFDVTVESEVVTFQSQSVRTAVTVGQPVQVLFTPLRPKLEGRELRGRVEAAVGDGRNAGIQKGGAREFRFGRLEPWQAALIELAHQMGQQLLVTVAETSSTCSLQALPADVQKVHNWAALINLGLSELSRAANDIVCVKGDDLDGALREGRRLMHVGP
jgi:hypothetical protein